MDQKRSLSGGPQRILTPQDPSKCWVPTALADPLIEGLQGGEPLSDMTKHGMHLVV